MWKKRNGVLNISVPDTNSKFSPVLRKNLRMVTKISFLPRFKVLTFLVGWFKLGLEVKIKQKNSFYFQTRLVQTCSNLLAERLSKKCSFPVTELKLCRILSEWDWIQTIERFSWAIRSCLPSFALWWIENWFREPKGYLNGSLCCFVRYSKHMYVCFCPGRVAELTEASAKLYWATSIVSVLYF